MTQKQFDLHSLNFDCSWVTPGLLCACARTYLGLLVERQPQQTTSSLSFETHSRLLLGLLRYFTFGGGESHRVGRPLFLLMSVRFGLRRPSFRVHTAFKGVNASRTERKKTGVLDPII